MHLQSNQETQQYQMPYRYPGSHNQYGQQVGTHTSSFTSNPQANVQYSQHCVSTQNGMYPPQAGYHENGSYGMPPASQNSGPTAPASYSISSGYNMRSDGHQNFQVAQNVTTHFQQASSVTTRNFQTNMTSPTYVVPNTPRQSQLLTTQDCHMQNNSQANMTPSTPMQSLLWTVQNNPQPSQNTAVISSKGLQISGQHQGNFNISVPYTYSHPAPTLPLQTSSDQRSQKQIHVISQHQPSDSMQYQQNVCMGELSSRGHAVQPTQNRANGHNLMQASTASLGAPGSNYQNLSGQTLTGNITLQTAVHTGTSLPFYTNNSTSPRSISSGLNGVVPPPYPCRAQSQMTPCQNTRRATSDANSSTTRTNGLPPPYPYRAQSQMNLCQNTRRATSDANSLTTGTTGLPPPYPYRAQSQMTPCQNMRVATSDANNTRTNGLPPPYCQGDKASVHTNQNNPTGDNFKRHETGAPNWSGVIHTAPLQQQNLGAASPQTTLIQQQVSQTVAHLTYHGPNKSNTTSKPEQHPLLTNLLRNLNNKNTDKICHKDTVTSLANVVHCSPNRSVQICRAVAVVPPISQQPADGGNTNNFDASSSLKIKDVWSFADEKQPDGDSDCSILMVPPSNEQASESNSHPKDVTVANGPTHEQSLVYPNRDSQSKQRENTAKEDAPKDKKIEDLDGLTKSAIAFRLGMVRKLVANMELREQTQLKKNKNAQDFARSILNCYWAGSYRNYIETELRGTFENILREAKPFHTEEDKQVFYGIKCLNQLINMYNSTTNGTGCDTAMENERSSWRNLSDESLDIDKELADGDFVKENFPSVLEKTTKRDFLNHTQASDMMSKEEHYATPLTKSGQTPEKEVHALIHVLTKPDQTHMNNKTYEDETEQTGHMKSPSGDDDKQYNMRLTTTNSGIHSITGNNDKENYLCFQLQVSSGNSKGQPYQNRIPAEDQDTACQPTYVSEVHDPSPAIAKTDILKMTNDSLKDSQDLYPEPRDCPKSPDHAMVDIKSTASPSEKESTAVSSESIGQDLVTAMEEEPTSASLIIAEQSHKSDEECPKSPNDPMLSMSITLLSMDELSGISKLFAEDSSPICLVSDDSEVEFVNSVQSEANLCQVQSPEELWVLDREQELSVLDRQEKTTFTPSVHKTVGTQTTKSENKEDTFLTDLSGKQKANRAKYSKNVNYTLKHQQRLHEENRQSTQSHQPSKHQVQSAFRNASSQTVQKSTKPPRLEIHIPNPSPSGVKASSPISPKPPRLEIHIPNPSPSGGLSVSPEHVERPSAVSHGKRKRLSSHTIKQFPIKKCTLESPKPNGNSDSSTNIMAPSAQASLQLTKKSNISKDTTNVPGKEGHRHKAGGPTGSTRERILKGAETSLSPEAPTPRDENKKIRCATFRIFGAKIVDPKGKNGETNYHSESSRDFPPVLSIVYTPQNSSARHKIKKSWEDCYVPTSKVRRQSDSEKRSSSPEVKNKAKNLPERGVQHQISSGKDKKEQRRSHGKEHQSKPKKHTKHRSVSLNDLRREAETRGGSKMSPQEKKNMALSVVKHLRQIHMKY
ncbi:hypothetical protein ACEWY4_002203 [Coilia grayii]|uniref:Uncharacterized protein n=1 Tax=Coilia grayii TaxID=363190 RepID=A0ABD1KV62_9TELE